MARKNIAQLSGSFETGDIPQGSDYADIFESNFNLQESSSIASGSLELMGDLTVTDITSSNNISASGNIWGNIGIFSGNVEVDGDIHADNNIVGDGNTDIYGISEITASGAISSSVGFVGDGSQLTNLPVGSSEWYDGGTFITSSKNVEITGSLFVSQSIESQDITASNAFHAQAHSSFEFTIEGGQFNMVQNEPDKNLFFLTRAGTGTIDFGTNNINSGVIIGPENGYITASGAISSSVGFVGDGSQLTNLPGGGGSSEWHDGGTYITSSKDVQITGSLNVVEALEPIKITNGSNSMFMQVDNISQLTAGKAIRLWSQNDAFGNGLIIQSDVGNIEVAADAAKVFIHSPTVEITGSLIVSSSGGNKPILTNDFVGIGDPFLEGAIPNAELHISGSGTQTQTIESSDNNAVLKLIANGSGHAFIDLEEGTDQRWLIGNFDTDDSFRIASGSAFSTTTLFELDRDGKTTLQDVTASVLRVNNGTNISPDSSGNGQFRINGNAYTAFIAMDNTAMYLGHNSSGRDFVLQTDETDRITIDGSSGDVYFENDISGSASSTASFGAFIGDGSQLSNLPGGGSSEWFNGGTYITSSKDVRITGSLVQGGNGLITSGNDSHAEGFGSHSSGSNSHAEGQESLSSGFASHTEGYRTTSSGEYSHAEGGGSIASGNQSHAEGQNTSAAGLYSHAEGFQSDTIGNGSHAEGNQTTAKGDLSHAEGGATISHGEGSHAEGFDTLASGSYSHAEGGETEAKGPRSHAEGFRTYSEGQYSHAEGFLAYSQGNYSHAEGHHTTSSGLYSHAEGNLTYAQGDWSHAEGYSSTSSGDWSHAEGESTIAWGSYSHTEGLETRADGEYAHAEGRITSASGNYSHAEGWRTKASSTYSHAEGNDTEASGEISHAEGSQTIASGEGAHAEGDGTQAKGNYSHAEGHDSITHGIYSHAEGIHTIASGSGQSVVGKFNTHGNTDSIFIIGDGASDGSRSDLALFNEDLISFKSDLEITGSLTVSETGSIAYLEPTETFINYITFCHNFNDNVGTDQIYFPWSDQAESDLSTNDKVSYLTPYSMSLNKLVVRFDDLNSLTGGTSTIATVRLRKHSDGTESITTVATASITNITASVNPADGNGPQTAMVLTPSDFDLTPEFVTFDRCAVSIQFDTGPTSGNGDYFVTSVWRTEMDI